MQPRNDEMAGELTSKDRQGSWEERDGQGHCDAWDVRVPSKFLG